MTNDDIASGGGPLVYVGDLHRPDLADDDHHHLVRVRRLRVGDDVVLGDGRGRWRVARLTDTGVEPSGDVVEAHRAAPPVTVAFALVKGAKPELVVQKLTELGVDHVRPFVAARSVVRWDDAKAAAALGRWQKVAAEASRQSRRAWLPEVHPVATFGEVAALPGALRADRHGAPLPAGGHTVLVGPEGGWDDAEQSAPLPTVGLGPGVLRAETAAIAAGALLVALRGGLVDPAARPAMAAAEP